MGCETWRDKLDLYLDGELASSDTASLSGHLKGCASCAADVLERVQLKRSVASAGKRYEPSAQFRSRMMEDFAPKPQRPSGWFWKIVAVPALLVLLLSVGVDQYARRASTRRERVYGELADLHIAALASSNPVDVVSTDRHTVKPWFEGKIPFSFNLPELQNTNFTLVGGRIAYLGQTPGAQLIYRLRKHEISVFVFPDRGENSANFPPGVSHSLSFTEETWSQNGLRYYVVGDVGAEDMQALSKPIRDAG